MLGQPHNSEDNREDILAEYKKLTALSEDDAAFVNTMLRISKVKNHILGVGDDFYNEEISGYEALVKIDALLSIIGEIRSDVQKKL